MVYNQSYPFTESSNSHLFVYHFKLEKHNILAINYFNIVSILEYSILKYIIWTVF